MKTYIVYEDRDILLAYKPAGIATQTARLGQQDMVSELKNYLSGQPQYRGKGEPYLGLVHRLDQPVAGILVFGKTKDENKVGKKLARPISLLFTIILAVGVIALVMFGVIPQLTRTMGSLMISIANFVPQMQNWIRDFSHNNQEIMKLVNQVQFNQDQAIKWGISILGSGAGNMMNTTRTRSG